jgi:hypothetical protein
MEKKMRRHGLKLGATIAAVATAFAMASATIAHADTFTIESLGQNLNAAPTGSAIFTFQSDTAGTAPTVENSTGAMGVTATFTGGNATVEDTSLANVYLAPQGDTASLASGGNNYLAVAYPNSAGTETIAFNKGFTEVGLYIGSIDTYNSITFLGTGGTIITGSQILAVTGGTSGDNANSDYVEFVDTTLGADITGVQFTTPEAAFEIDNLSVANGIPEPSTWTMILIGFGLVGLQLRRRRVVEINC